MNLSDTIFYIRKENVWDFTTCIQDLKMWHSKKINVEINNS